MDYEKAYKEALERARMINNGKDVDIEAGTTTCEYIFPELRESEDEKVRNFISNELACLRATDGKGSDRYEELTEAIAWLEKQGQQKSIDYNEELKKCRKNPLYFFDKYVKLEERKSADKVESKFHEGDWVANDYCVGKVIALTDDAYLLDSGQGIPFSCEHNAHLWTIKDAKPGDVLACESGWTCIFKTLVNDENFSSYCFMDNTKWFCETGSECHTLKEEFVKAYNGKIYPATKEQRDLLYRKMHEAGYTFDFEKKELKKLKFRVGDEVITENEESLTITRIDEEGYWSNELFICDFDSECVWDLVEQKSAEWSEEDEKNLRRAIRATKVVYPETADWLKSLKDRVQPQNNIVTDKELAQAKKDAYNDALDKIEYHSGEPTFDDGWNAAIWYLKKRNDRPQSHWTPSDAQIQALKEACDKSWEPDGLDPLYTLYKDLKKLKGE